jgi:hypothetical protein
MERKIKYYWLDITVDDTATSFKTSAFNEPEAEKICKAYFPGKTVKILGFNEGRWEMGAGAV